MIRVCEERRTCRRSILVGVLAILALATPQAVEAQQHTWTAYTYNTVGTLVQTKGFREICERIEAESGGRIKVSFHIGGSLQIKADNINQAVGENIVQLADDAFFAGSVPVAGLVRLPMLIKDESQLTRALKITDPAVDARYRTLGVGFLGSYSYPSLTIWSRKPLASLKDIEGQRIRTPSPEYSEFIKRFKGNAATLGVAEVPAAIERGVVDGVITSSTLGGLSWKDLLKFNYRIGVSRPTSNIIVNADAFNKLPPDLQQVVRKVVAEGVTSITANLQTEEADSTKRLEAEGLKVSQPTAQEVELAEKELAPYWDEWAKQRGPVAMDLLKRVRGELGR